ncbi:uncharacterized protein L203_105097 [Cryptococcus depauperatus CBS 7841]|uniref:Quinone oxidoreductase n=1 Tax=Cryptococcus depauperatus CBS 7841 TaxID=1295531 RepID=A0AAJ8M3M7_9TREE
MASSQMRALQVLDWSQGAKAVDAAKPPAPAAGSSAIQIRVLAAGVHQLVRSRASGRHYSSRTLPHTPGVDGVGVDTSCGRAVYFSLLGEATGGQHASEIGTMVEYVNVRSTCIAELPEGVDPAYAAAMMNPIMSSWMALRYRAGDAVKSTGWSCLVVGATGASGRMAVRTARAQGAGRIIGAARNEDKLSAVEGLDARVVLRDPPSETDWSVAADASVVLDYLWGPWPGAFLAATAKTKSALTWISIGAVAGPDAAAPGVPAAALRGRDVTIRGSGAGSWTAEQMEAELGGMVAVLKGCDVARGEVVRVRLEDAEAGTEAGGKLWGQAKAEGSWELEYEDGCIERERKREKKKKKMEYKTC